MTDEIKRIVLEKHFEQMRSINTTGGRWQPSLIKGALFSTGYRFMDMCRIAEIVDPGFRVHGAAAATFWYKDASRRDWIMPSSEEIYQRIARTFNLEEIVDPFYGPYLLYKEKWGQTRILLPDEGHTPEFVIVVDEEWGREVRVATLKELELYYTKRGLVQKGMYKKIMRPYRRSVK